MTRGRNKLSDVLRHDHGLATAGAFVAALQTVAKYRGWQGAILGLSIGVLSTGAAAQLSAPDLPVVTDPDQQSVATRARPDYDALGLRAASFLIFPTVGLTETYDSNVFATPTQVKSDFYTTATPAVNVRSDWNNHALNFYGAGEIKRYAQEVSENVSNAVAAVTGRLDVMRDFYLLGGTSYQLQHEDRSTPDTLYNQKSPTQYQVAGAQLAAVYNGGRIGLRLDGLVNYFTYDNGVTTLNVPVIETDRNRIEYTVTPRVSYEIVPGYSAFIKAPINFRQYQSQFNAFGYNQDSWGYEIDAGTAVKITSLITGEIYVGYLTQNYTGGRSPAVIAAGGPPLQSDSGVSFGGNLLWNITELTSIRANLGRAVEESYFIPASGSGQAPPGSYIESSVSVSVEHELLRNILLTGLVGYVNDAWESNPRVDNSYQADGGVRYLINRNLNAAFDASYRQRQSNAFGGDYSREVIMARINTQF